MLELRGIRTAMKDASCSTSSSSRCPTRERGGRPGTTGPEKARCSRLLALLEHRQKPGALERRRRNPGRPPASTPARDAGRARADSVSRTVTRESRIRSSGPGQWDATRPMAHRGVGPPRTAALLSRRLTSCPMAKSSRVAVARALALRTLTSCCWTSGESAGPRGGGALYRASRPASRASVAVCIASHQLEDAYRYADGHPRAPADGRSCRPSRPRTCSASSCRGDGLKTARVGSHRARGHDRSHRSSGGRRIPPNDNLREPRAAPIIGPQRSQGSA